MDPGWRLDGPSMEPRPTLDVPWMDPGCSLARPWMEPGWSLDEPWNAPWMDIGWSMDAPLQPCHPHPSQSCCQTAVSRGEMARLAHWQRIFASYSASLKKGMSMNLNTHLTVRYTVRVSTSKLAEPTRPAVVMFLFNFTTDSSREQNILPCVTQTCAGSWL